MPIPVEVVNTVSTTGGGGGGGSADFGTAPSGVSPDAGGVGNLGFLGSLLTGLGRTSDAAATVGAVGTVSAKLRTATTLLEQIRALLAGTLTVTGAISGTVTANLGTLGGAATDAVVQAVRDRLPTTLTAGGNLRSAILEALPAGTNILGRIGIDQTTPGTTDSVSVKKTALTPSAPAAGAVGTTSNQLVAANSNRKGLILTNTHATQTVSLGLGATAVANSGIILGPGGVWAMGEFDFTTVAVNGIASGAATNVAIQEFV